MPWDEFDILVTDTSMPGLSGPDLIKEIWALRANLPAVLLSGYMRPDDAEKARELVITNILLKPHTANDPRTCFTAGFANSQENADAHYSCRHGAPAGARWSRCSGR